MKSLPKAPEIGRVLKNFRLDKGMTQAQFATFLGVSRDTVARLEAGREVGDLNRRKIEKKLMPILAAEAA